MWSTMNWKEKMTPAMEQVVHILQANLALNHTCYCMICGDEYFNTTHLLGPKHFGKLMALGPENKPVCTNSLWQCWHSQTGQGTMAVNHADGTLQMVRLLDGNEPAPPLFSPAPAVTGQSRRSDEISADDPHARVHASVRVVPL
jgi:hypothetical protein